jgi:hypothetical protein
VNIDDIFRTVQKTVRSILDLIISFEIETRGGKIDDDKKGKEDGK